MSYMNYLFAFLLAYVIVHFSIPVLKKFAIRIDFVDRPTNRKAHANPVPHLASIGIYAGFVIAYFSFTKSIGKEDIGFLIGSFLIIGIGLVDDWFKTKEKEFPPLPKFLVQVGAAAIAYFSGAVFYGFTNPFTDQFVVLPTILQFSLSVTWVFGVTTVINFIDGLDGLAGGISAISAATLFVVALAKGQPQSAMMAIVLVAVLIGYLKYNKQPAQIYMGDAGATFIGYTLGIIALEGAFKQATLLSVAIPILALGVPIFDNVFVVLKRIMNGKPPYQADRTHAHHRLLSAGLKPSQVVIFLCLANLCFGLFSIIITLLQG